MCFGLWAAEMPLQCRDAAKGCNGNASQSNACQIHQAEAEALRILVGWATACKSKSCSRTVAVEVQVFFASGALVCLGNQSPRWAYNSTHDFHRRHLFHSYLRVLTLAVIHLLQDDLRQIQVAGTWQLGHSTHVCFEGLGSMHSTTSSNIPARKTQQGQASLLRCYLDPTSAVQQCSGTGRLLGQTDGKYVANNYCGTTVYACIASTCV